jgi:pSer/pThr/pTyr-binding forkhead associated (FHA) protein
MKWGYQEGSMRDGFTQRVEVAEHDGPFEEFMAKWQASIVILSGDEAGSEHNLEKPNVSMGRGPDTDLAFDDSSMSREHAALEFVGGNIRLRDLGSLNGITVNGSDVKTAELKNGDRFKLGEHEFQFVLQKRTKHPKTYVVDDE